MIAAICKLFEKFRSRTQPVYEVYTDGSQKGRWGSWAFVIRKDGRTIAEKSARVRESNSTRMEIRAACEALKALPEKAQIDLYSDSRILIDAMNLGAVKKSFELELIELKALIQKRSIRWHWQKAHSGYEFNERCDFLCRLARNS